ncbi:MAG: hypothetical protein PHC51_06510 [bacterium]|nr:hypothetical protein [bacterium]
MIKVAARAIAGAIKSTVKVADNSSDLALLAFRTVSRKYLKKAIEASGDAAVNALQRGRDNVRIATSQAGLEMAPLLDVKGIAEAIPRGVVASVHGSTMTVAREAHQQTKSVVQEMLSPMQGSNGLQSGGGHAEPATTAAASGPSRSGHVSSGPSAEQLAQVLSARQAMQNKG